MVFLNPRRVRFGEHVLDDVSSVVIERSAVRTVEAWSDDGPHAVLVDVAEARVAVRIEQNIAGQGVFGGPLASDGVPSRPQIGEPVPGEMGELIAEWAPSGADLGRRRMRMQAVVVQVSDSISAAGSKRTLTLRGVSAEGAADPIVVEEL